MAGRIGGRQARQEAAMLLHAAREMSVEAFGEGMEQGQEFEGTLQHDGTHSVGAHLFPGCT